MVYLTDAEQIKEIIVDLTQTSTLWVDTEVADYASKNPRLSIIQVLAYPYDLTGQRTYIFDVLDRSQLRYFFIDQIMKNERIKKVFHNASYDLKFLGKKQAQNIFCTFQFAQKIPYYLLPVRKYSLKFLTEYLTDFDNLNKQEQTSDWGIRPLTFSQLKYAQMDCVYLAQVYFKLTALQEKISPEPSEEDITNLLHRYQEIEEQWLYLDSEIKHLQTRIKEAMIIQNRSENNRFKLKNTERKKITTNLQELLKLIQDYNLKLEYKMTLTKDIQSQLGEHLNHLNIDVETSNFYQLKNKQ